ncbi:putative ATP/GTP-binding protein [hydrothermal vent metagenome]|uniref:Putative ATP/GTP-binding protein n=1 Tax=hydrothermal vent metagenome TaxID=652676 RepID=A0A3B0V5M5_9ZZZZ
MKSNFKIIFSGPVGAGKTTAITSISDIKTIQTEESSTDAIKQQKPNTTVALDYGAIILGDGTRIHLYGTPGQKRFDFMWDILSTGGIGLLLLIDGSDKEALEYLEFFLKSFEKFIKQTSVVVGITKQDETKQYNLEKYQQVAGDKHPIIPIFEIDARNRHDIALMIETLLYTLDPKLSISSTE